MVALMFAAADADGDRGRRPAWATEVGGLVPPPPGNFSVRREGGPTPAARWILRSGRAHPGAAFNRGKPFRAGPRPADTTTARGATNHGHWPPTSGTQPGENQAIEGAVIGRERSAVLQLDLQLTPP